MENNEIDIENIKIIYGKENLKDIIDNLMENIVEREINKMENN